MDETPKFNLPFILPNQAQKHVTANEAFRRIDTLAQLSVLSSVRGDQPDAPQNGDAYILTDNATGPLWSQYDAGTIAMSYDGGWQFVAPYPGWLAWDQEAQSILVFEAGAWREATSSSDAQSSISRFGINTEPDDNNLFAVKSDFELLSHDDVTPGSGSARKVINKALVGDTSSVIFQSGFSARAEMGLTGTDDFTLRTSADGQSFQDAARFDRTSGKASFPAGIKHALTGRPLSTQIFTPGGEGETSIFQIILRRQTDQKRAQVVSASQKILTLSGLSSSLFFINRFMFGVSMLRIWNISKTPAQPAWVVRARASVGVDVFDAASIADWVTGEEILVGDPEEVSPGPRIALDISPMMLRFYGQVFAQSGVTASMRVASGDGQQAQLNLSPNGTTGSFIGPVTNSSGDAAFAQITVATPTPSPISDSNLIFVQEAASGGEIGACSVQINSLHV